MLFRSEVLVARSYSRSFTMGYWASRLEHFHPLCARLASAVVRLLGLWEKPLRLNLGDMMEVVARKK